MRVLGLGTFGVGDAGHGGIRLGSIGGGSNGGWGIRVEVTRGAEGGDTRGTGDAVTAGRQGWGLAHGQLLALNASPWPSRMASPPPCLQLPVYVPSDAEKADPALYAANMRQYMVRIGLYSVDSGNSEAPNPTWTQGLAEIWMFLGGDKVVVHGNMQSKRDSGNGGGEQRLAE